MKRVLVVDDDAELLSSMKQLIELALPDAEVVAARDGLEAWAMLRGNGFKAVVTDYMMPRMDGIELTANAKRRSPGLPVIMVSAFSDEGVKDRARQAGVSRFLPKPFAIADFVSAVAEGIGRNGPAGASA